MCQRILKFTGIWVILIPLITFASTDQTGARESADVFIQAVLSGKPARLAPVLPEGGKILVSLRTPANGKSSRAESAYLGVSQTRAVLKDLLSGDTLSDGRIQRIDCSENSYAQVEISFRRTPSSGLGPTVRIRLGLQPEKGRWVLREIRETPR